jgi:circadian clock protein KaiB
MNEKAPENAGKQPHYQLILFVAGNEPNSMTARVNLDLLCAEELKGRCAVEIVDVMEDFALALEHNIVLTPTLLIQNSRSSVMVIGNLNNRRKVRAALNMPEE